MVLSSGFSTQGAVPQQPPQSPGFGSTPFGKALSGLVYKGPTAPSMSLPSGMKSWSSAPQANPVTLPKTQGILPPTGLAVKSHTVNNVDGSSTTQTYHPPTNTAKVSQATPQSTAYTTTPPEVNPNANFQGNTIGAQSGTQAPAPATPTFSGLVGNLAGFGSQPSEVQKGSLSTAQNSADTYNRIQKQLEQSRMNEANAEATNRLNPIPIGDQTGREAVIRNQYLAQQNALAAEAQGATNLYSSALSSATTGQGQQIDATKSAAGYASPIISAQGQANYGIGGQGGGQVTPDNPFYKTLDSYAQQAANGQYGSIPSSITSNPVLNAQMNQMAKVYNPNYNPVVSSAQSGITTQQTQQVEGYRSVLQQGQNLQAQLKDLITHFGLNPNDINAVNSGIQKIAQNTSNPYYKQLSNYINEVANTYSQALTPPGGSATDTTRGIATSMLDATAKGSSIIDVMDSLDNAIKAKIAGVPTIGNSTQGNTSGGSYTSSSGNSYRLPY